MISLKTRLVPGDLSVLPHPANKDIVGWFLPVYLHINDSLKVLDVTFLAIVLIYKKKSLVFGSSLTIITINLKVLFSMNLIRWSKSLFIAINKSDGNISTNLAFLKFNQPYLIFAHKLQTIQILGREGLHWKMIPSFIPQKFIKGTQKLFLKKRTCDFRNFSRNFSIEA